MTLRLACAAALLAVLPRPAAAQQRHPLTVRDFLAMARPADPAVSPDGRWVAYDVTTPDLAAGARRTDLMLVPAAGGEARRISADSLGGRSPRWSPDGTALAYVTTRGGTPQVWVYEPATGARRQLTSLSTGADGPVWAPAGGLIAFTSQVWPGCADDACNARRAAEEAQPGRPRLYDHLLYRHWMSWDDGSRSHLFVVSAAGGAPRDLLAGKDWDAPVPPFGGSSDYAWSPDGKTLAFTTKFGRDQAWTTNTDVYAVSVSAGGGEPVNVTAGMGGAESAPAFSPDGKSLAFLSQATPAYESDRIRLMVKDLATGAVREVPRGFDRWVSEYAWEPGGQGFVVIAEDRQRDRFFHVTLSGEVHAVHPGGDVSQLSIAAVQPDVVAYVSDAMNQPPQVYLWRIDHARPTPPLQLTHLNADLLATLDMPAGEEIGWIGAGGDSVHGWLLKPPGFDPSRRYPLLVLVHGGPQGAWLDQFHPRWNPELFAAPGYVTFMPNPRGSTGFGQRFIDQIGRDWGGRVYEDIMRGVDKVAALPWVDSTRMGAAGGSFGGHMVNWINTQTTRFKVLVAHDGDFNLSSFYGTTEELWFPEHDLGGPPWADRTDYRRWSPDRFAQQMRTPELVIHGGMDFRVPVSEGMQAFTALQRQGVPSQLLYFPDEGHFVARLPDQQVWWTTVHAWLAQYLHP